MEEILQEKENILENIKENHQKAVLKENHSKENFCN